MTRRFPRPILLACIALTVACGSEEGFEPAARVPGSAPSPKPAPLPKTAPSPVPAPVGYPEIAGVYDLTASITDFDPAWEDLTGYRYIAVLTLHEELGPPWTRGTCTDFHLVGPGGDSTDIAPGFVTGSLDRGRVLLEVRNDHWMGLTLMVGAVASSGFIEGGFGCCGHIGGTFTAERR